MQIVYTDITKLESLMDKILEMTAQYRQKNKFKGYFELL
jgi:hypothetical protein